MTGPSEGLKILGCSKRSLCSECRPIRVVVLMVMLTGYLPENAKRAFYNADLVDLHHRFFIRISRQIARMDCLAVCSFNQ